MKRFAFYLFGAVLLGGMAYYGSVLSDAAAKQGKEDASFDTITVNRIVVRSHDRKHSVLIEGMQNGVGVWVGKDGQWVTLISRDHGPYIGLMEEGADAAPLAFTLGKGADVQIQVAGKKGTKFLPAESLLKLKD